MLRDGVQTREPADACAGCTLAGTRRDFLRDAVGMALGALALLAGRDAAASLPVSWTTGAATGSMVRYPLPAADGAQIDKPNQVILVRWQNAVYAFALSCPHQNTALRWNANESRFQCPKHKSKYQPDGVFISGRATRGMDRHALRAESGEIVVDVDVLYKQDEDAAGWAAAVIRV
jgi:nitrite reductase/ring-hydroxylating ferredoxin subunit